MNSNLDKKSKDEIYKQIATQLLQEVLKEDLSTIVNRDRIFEIFKKISTKENSDESNLNINNKNYLLVHTKLQNNLINDQSNQNDDALMELLMKNNEKLYNEIYQKIKNEFFFDIELHKYGRTFNGIRKRWAYILYPDYFGSTKEPALKSDNPPKKKGPPVFKNKNLSLENMKNIAIQPFAVNLKDYKADKAKKPVRIVIEFLDALKNNKISEIYLYFENMKNAKQIYELMLLMRMNLIQKKNPQTLQNLALLSNKVENAHKFVIMKKIVDVKNQIKAKKVAKIEAERLKQQQEELDKSMHVNYNSNRISQYSNKYTLGTKFENLLLNFFKKEENLFTQFGSINKFKNAKETLKRVFLNKLKTKQPDKYLYETPAAYIQTIQKIDKPEDNEKKVGFKIKSKTMDGIIIRNLKNDNYLLNQKISGKSLIKNNNNYYFENFSIKNFSNASELTFNTDKTMILFDYNNKDVITNEKSCLYAEDILQVNSVYLHLNEKANYEENCVLINGPKKHLELFLKYKLNLDFIKKNNLIALSNKEFIEPEFHGLRIEQTFLNNKHFNPLIIQVFHASVNIPRNYVNYLERKNTEIFSTNNNANNSNNNFDSKSEMKQSSEIFNLNFDNDNNNNNKSNKTITSNIKLNRSFTDFYFYISFTINGKFYARTKLTKGVAAENSEFIFVEINNQILLNYTQINLLKNFQMKISVNLIPASCLDIDSNSDIDLKSVLNINNVNNSNNNIYSSESNLNTDLIYSKFKLENFIEHMKPHEIAFCLLDNQSLKANQNEFILKNNFNEFDSRDNYIVLNIINNSNLISINNFNINNQENTLVIDNTKFIAKDYSVGQEIYYLVEYSKEDFDKVLSDPLISDELKEKFYNVEFDYENNFILRPHIKDQKQFLEVFSSNDSSNFSKQQTETMIKIFKNAKYKYLPKCEVFESKENLSKSTNMYLNKKYIFESGISDKKLIYKLRKIQKYSMCKIIGIGISQSILLKDLFLGKVFAINNLDLLTGKGVIDTNNIKFANILNQNNSKNLIENVVESKNNNIKNQSQNNINKISAPSENQLNSTNILINNYEFAENFFFKHTQENPISIYDFSEIDIKSVQNVFNHHWRICLKFANKLEIDTFLFYLRDIRRKANFNSKSLSIASERISTKMLLESVTALKSQFQKLNIMLEKIEFKKNLKLPPGFHKLQISLFKGNQFKLSQDAADSDKKNRSILELLDDENFKYYKNSLLQNPEILKEYQFFKASRNNKIQLPSQFEFDSESFAKLNNQINFKNTNLINSFNNNSVNNINLNSYDYKLFELNAQSAIDKVFTLQTQFAKNDNSLFSMQDQFNFFCEADLSEVVSGSCQADFIRLPLYSVSDKSLVGMIDFKFWIANDSVKNLAKEMQFDNLFNLRFSKKDEINKLLKDQNGNSNPIAKTNPNLFKIKILRLIAQEINLDLNTINEKLNIEKDGAIRNKLIKCLLNKGVLGYDSLIKNFDGNNKNNLWSQIIPDQEFLKLKFLKKFYIKKKKRNFYAVYRSEEWRKFFKQTKLMKECAYSKPTEINLFEQKTAIIETLSHKEILISAKKENSEKYLKIKKFIEMGIPENMRLTAWESLLNTDGLCLITIQQLQKQINSGAAGQGLTNKEEVFEFFLRNVIENKKFNINFSFIDNDMNYLYKNNDNFNSVEAENEVNEKFEIEKINERNINLKRIKNICKAYFLWTDLNISTSIAQNKDKNPRKYIYFFGMLQLIKILLSVFKSDYVVFWVLIGLSQVIELFYQSNPLLSNQLNYSKIYIMITKLIMQRHFETIINQLIKLNFPIEFFLSKLITSLFSTSFETDFFLRLMDIIVFDATIKTNEYDKLDYLRFICTIPLVLLKLNESKILDCKTITELESIFSNLFKKTFDHEIFLEQIKSYEEKFYQMNTYLEQFFDLNKANSWDIKRRQVSESLNAHFAPIEDENTNFLNKLKKLKFSFDENFIENYEGILLKEFTTLRRLYSKKDYETPCINHDEEYSDIISGNKFKLAVCICDFKFFSNDLKNIFKNKNFNNSYSTNDNNNNNLNSANEIFHAYLKFSEDKFAQNYVFQPEVGQRPFVLKGFLGPNPQYEINHFDFAESFPTYLNIFLYTTTGFFIGTYRYEIVSKDLFKSISLYSENANKNSFSVLQIKIVKAYTSKVSKTDEDLDKLLFRPPRYLYDFKIDNLIDETNYKDTDAIKLKKYAEIFNNNFVSEILNKNSIEENSFMKQQLNLNNLAFELNEYLEKNYLYFKSNPNANFNKANENKFKTFVGKFINLNSSKNNKSTNNNSLINDFDSNLNNLNNSILPASSVFANLNIQANKIFDILLDNFNYRKEAELYVKANTTDKSENKPSSLEATEYFSFRTMTRVKNLNNEFSNYNNTISNLTDNSQEIKNILKSWLDKNDTSLEEILYSLVLIDTYSITIYEKLYLLYQIGKMRNFALCSKDSLSLKKFKEMIYALYKRFMVNFNKSEIDVMIDYLIKKEEFACLRFALIHEKSADLSVKAIINENAYEQRENILSVLKIKKSEKICEDIKSYMQNYFNLLRNNYLMDKISLSYFNSIWDLFVPKIAKGLKINPNEILQKWKFDKITIDFTSDNIRKITEFDVELLNKDTFKIKANTLNERIIKNEKLEGVKKVMEDLIVEDINCINLANIDNDESVNVTFDLFKDVFFNLPFISEFIRASCGFTEENFEGLNTKLNMVKVHLNVGSNCRFFSFAEGIFANDSLNNYHNETKNISYNFMGESLFTTNSFQDVFERIALKLKRTNDAILDNILPYFMANPNMIIISTNIENTEKYERMKFYDPLFASESIRKCLKKTVIIEIKLDVNDDFSRFDREYQLKEPGYMKLKYDEDCYEWRQCKIKTNPNSKMTAKLISKSVLNKRKQFFFRIFIF